MIRFSTLAPGPHGEAVEINVREIPQSAIAACPHFIMTPDHYRPDGSCLCDDRSATIMRTWGYRWRGGRWR